VEDNKFLSKILEMLPLSGLMAKMSPYNLSVANKILWKAKIRN
jgi:hypothetical protein